MNDSEFTIRNNVLKGVEKTYQTDREYTSLGKFVLSKLENNPDLVGQVDVLTGKEYTYEKMRERSVRCALWMRSQGLVLGDVVVICSHNQLDTAMASFAALYLGAAFNPLESSSNKKELDHMLSITEPKIAFVSEESATNVAAAARDAKLELKIVVFGQASGFLEFESVIAQHKVGEVRNFRCTPIEKPDMTASIMCTSGTTGSPKGVALSHAALLRQMHRAYDAGMRDHICMMFSPHSWMTSTLCMFMSLFLNTPRMIAPPFEEYSACAFFEKYKVSWFLAAPSMINRLLKSGALNKYNLSCVKQVVCTGAPLTLASREAFIKSLPNARITVCYGLTEVGGFLSIQGLKSKPGSCGNLLKNCQLKVIDPDTGRILGANRKGELLLKTASMMSSYYRNPQATAEAIDEEGWMHSGDLGYYDEDGDIFVVDRLKELIKYRGYHISPSDIEKVIWTHPGVKDVAVVGLPHPQDDEHPIAFVVRIPDSTGTGREVTEKELIDLVAAEVSDSKRLRGGVRFIDHIPKTTSGKIQRKDIRAFARSMVTE